MFGIWNWRWVLSSREVGWCCGTVIREIRWRRSDGIRFRRRVDPRFEPEANFGFVGFIAYHIQLVNGEVWSRTLAIDLSASMSFISREWVNCSPAGVSGAVVVLLFKSSSSAYFTRRNFVLFFRGGIVKVYFMYRRHGYKMTLMMKSWAAADMVKFPFQGVP